MICGLDLNGLSELRASESVSGQSRGESSLTYTASSNCFAAKALLPSAFSASAMLYQVEYDIIVDSSDSCQNRQGTCLVSNSVYAKPKRTGIHPRPEFRPFSRRPRPPNLTSATSGLVYDHSRIAREDARLPALRVVIEDTCTEHGLNLPIMTRPRNPEAGTCTSTAGDWRHGFADDSACCACAGVLGSQDEAYP